MCMYKRQSKSTLRKAPSNSAKVVKRSCIENCPIYTNSIRPDHGIFLFPGLVRVEKQWFTIRKVDEVHIIVETVLRVHVYTQVNEPLGSLRL